MTVHQPVARQARDIICGAAAHLTGRDARGPDRQVRRNSLDVDDPRAQVFRPIGDGTKAGGMAWRDALIRTAKEYNVQFKQRGTQGPLTHTGVRVLEALTDTLDYRTGRLDPALTTIMRKTGLVKATVVAALRRLKEHGFLDWIRRSCLSDDDEGPRRKQATNAYFFDLSRAHRRVRARIAQLVRRMRSPAPRKPRTIDEAPPELRAALSRFGAGIAAKEAASMTEPGSSSQSVSPDQE